MMFNGCITDSVQFLFLLKLLLVLKNKLKQYIKPKGYKCTELIKEVLPNVICVYEVGQKHSFHTINCKQTIQVLQSFRVLF